MGNDPAEEVELVEAEAVEVGAGKHESALAVLLEALGELDGGGGGLADGGGECGGGRDGEAEGVIGVGGRGGVEGLEEAGGGGGVGEGHGI